MAATLLIIGVVTTLGFLLVLFVEGALRSGYRPMYHAGSELALGDRGWIQIANFLQMGLGMLAFAVGVARALDTVAGPIFLAVFGFLLIVSGVFVEDPLRGYPPGVEATVSRSGKIHRAAGPLAFLALFVAALFLAGQLDGVWRGYTLVTAVLGFGFMAWTGFSFQRDFEYTGLVQRGLLLVYFTWIAVLGVHLTLSL